MQISRLEQWGYLACFAAAAFAFVPDAYAWPAFWLGLALFALINRAAGAWRERERRDEHQLVGDAAADQLMARALSELKKRSGRQAHPRSSATEPRDGGRSAENSA